MVRPGPGRQHRDQGPAGPGSGRELGAFPSGTGQQVRVEARSGRPAGPIPPGRPGSAIRVGTQQHYLCAVEHAMVAAVRAGAASEAKGVDSFSRAVEAVGAGADPSLGPDGSALSAAAAAAAAAVAEGMVRQAAARSGFHPRLVVAGEVLFRADPNEN